METVLFVAPLLQAAKCQEHLSRLREAGVVPATVTSIDAALTLLQQFPVAAVVMHSELTAENAEQCARIAATRTPVVVVPTLVTTEAIHRHLAAGCAAVICEPFAARELRAVIQRVKAGERAIVYPADGAFILARGGAAAGKTAARRALL